MKKIYAAALLAGILFGAGIFSPANAQRRRPIANDPLMKIYRATPTKINDLINTKLDVRFDYKKCFLYGKEWVTLKPHFYPTDTLRLDAKGMDIHNLSIVKNGKYYPLKYTYDDSLSLAIHLDRVYHNNESYTIYISYTSKPNELKEHGSAAITDAKGLYFINPDSTVKGKPVQIWTQGETESSSAWFPTIDKPEQKTTDEISMTVPAKYVTLSNGKLISQKNNHDGTRTDTWKMALPQSPYLFMMAVGDFKIYHDHWRNIPVDYYLEPKFAPYAKQIFGHTPQMIGFYSRILGVNYPWNKYAQIVVRDYVSGAMENTTATLHGQQVQETPRELIDAYYNSDNSEVDIAHELFHQWFGDYVTCESWSNITMNESFADFAESLWGTHEYGRDYGDAHMYRGMQEYLETPGARTKDLVRFHYDNREDVFDIVSYEKGGNILNMLRDYLGDAAFFKGLNLYLTRNAFKTGEAQQLRLPMEEVSGIDLNWFFNEWYYGAGNPDLTIDYKWDEGSKTETVYMHQTQKGNIFTFPFAVDVYAGGKKVRYKEWMRDKDDTLTFNTEQKPDLVNVDADKTLVVQKTDNKPLDQYVFQYFNAPLYVDRYEAISAAADNQNDGGAQKVMIAAMEDKYYGLRIMAIRALDMANDQINNTAMPILKSLAQTDVNTLVRAAAITKLGEQAAKSNMDLFKQALNSQSYAIQGAALDAIARLDPKEGLNLAKGFEKDNEKQLTSAMLNLYANYGSDEQWPFVYSKFISAERFQKFRIRGPLAEMIQRVNSPVYAQQGIEALKDMAIDNGGRGSSAIKDLLEDIKTARKKMNDDTSANAAEDAIKQINEAAKNNN